ncbi:hypothetical protein [Kribbella sindirgiensis]|uniref:hypothetical protein n=1 Tax=Kribbella sindirgiensis TaxID=1124744 RepID=UPI0013F3CECF|nr:hypothetical protein [Kribbella sindirgiensis]
MTEYLKVIGEALEYDPANEWTRDHERCKADVVGMPAAFPACSTLPDWHLPAQSASDA